MSDNVSNNFSDSLLPEKREQILSELSTAEDIKKTEDVIEKYFPGWLVYSIDGYSKDYPHFQKNWNVMCKDCLKTTPKKIILVSLINFDKDHETLNKVAEYMTRFGYCVRRTEEFIVCPTCELAIPCKEIWAGLKNLKFPVPTVWKNRCSGC
jgi:hypothetical protein